MHIVDEGKSRMGKKSQTHLTRVQDLHKLLKPGKIY